MIIYRYFCIVCKFVSHTIEPWKGNIYECPSCHVKVELRALPPEKIDEQQGETPQHGPN